METDPVLPRYRAEEDLEWPLWIDRKADELLAILSTRRQVLTLEVKNMSSAQLIRTAVHPRFGRMNVAQWLEFFLLHEAHHLLSVLQRSREQPPH